ncbi:MAG TPA: aminotransferase class I/II-fold pyridoxal phosphate-dependent enzyme [Gemmatimonadales bacterium]
MPFTPFELERWQSQWEHRVRANLSESGVHPMSIAELLVVADTDPDALLRLRMGYNQGDGSDELRHTIASMYPGASGAQVTVTVGSSEANFVVCWTLLEPGDHVAILGPAYMQTWGLARTFGAEVTTFALDPRREWQPDRAEMQRAIRPGTKLVIVTNPNNPTGQTLSDDSRAALVERTSAVGAWLLADEVYRGAERDGKATPSFWDTAERVVVVSGLSKAYGLPGLRIGWIVGPPDLKDAVWRRHDYTVICPNPASDFLARCALTHRERIWQRTRDILNANYPILDEWLRSFDGLFDWRAPACGAICFARYESSMSALDVVERVRTEADILLVPGEHFHMPGHFRFGYGNEQQELRDALVTLKPTLERLLRD